MERTPVTSSFLTSVGYDAALKELHIEFANGAVHVYQKVPPEVHAAMLEAESVGKFFAAWVKGQFESHRKEEEKE